jgi:hypothetical protein
MLEAEQRGVARFVLVVDSKATPLGLIWVLAAVAGDRKRSLEINGPCGHGSPSLRQLPGSMASFQA